MRSCLYECQVTHARFSPRRHSFRYRLFYFALDLDEIQMLSERNRFFSVNRPNLYSFRDGDFLPTNDPPAAGLKERVTAYAARKGVDLSGGRILLVTLPRILGHLFNPISLYFCVDRSGRPAAAIAEVTNTFREMKPYFLTADARAAETGEFRLRVPKHFYVSPFSDVDVSFDFTLRCPAGHLSAEVDDYTGAVRTLATRLTGTRRSPTSGRLAWYSLKYPLLSLRIISSIHWQAFRLWLKRVPWFAKAARASAQSGFLSPHRPLGS
jgi:DUF1365 family protein